uniref:Transposase n=1 Tax=Steinernema glaseri TaxID=37863 RepID=A0A1I7ZPG5_9BILA
MLWLAVGLEGIGLQPAVVGRVTGGPDDRADTGLGQVQLKN